MHLSSVFVWQEEHSDHGGGGDLVVEGLSVEVDVGREHLDQVATTRLEAVDLVEDGKGVALLAQHRGLLHYLIPVIQSFFIHQQQLIKTYEEGFPPR